METIEKKVADAVLQKAKVIEIGGVSYEVAPPSVATLILISDLLSNIPKVELGNEPDVLVWTLKNAKDCEFLGDIIATLILGAKGLSEERVVTKEHLFGLIKKNEVVFIDHKKNLSSKILQDITPKQLSNLASNLLESMEIGFFFQVTTFLLDLNLTKATKTTASGL